MITENHPLAGMLNYNQFVIWQSIPVKGGKTKKVTINPTTLRNHDAHDLAIQFNYDDAIKKIGDLGGYPYSLGFVFKATDPFWFFDLDHCIVNGVLNEQAAAFYNHFRGCAVEVSQSGEGLHIFGTGSGIDPDHRKKNIKLGLEFYTQDRFVALTGNCYPDGDCNFDASIILPDFVNYYFPKKEYRAAEHWTTEHDEISNPIDDDDKLITKMISTINAKSVFGGGVSVADLWECNTKKLAVKFPAIESGDFDRSSADQALCNHLAFWTGGNCERIERLFNRSMLVRGKWQDRQDYRQDTILNAVGGCQNFYGASDIKKQRAATSWQQDQTSLATVEIELTGGCQMVAYEQRAEFFKGHHYLTSLGAVFCPDGVIRNQPNYNSMYSTVEFLTPFGDKPIKEAWKAYITATDLKRSEVFGVLYRPQYEFGSIFNEDGKLFVNEYVNNDGQRFSGDPAPFLNHIKLMLPNGDDAEILISWMAALIQNAGKKFLWSPFIQGIEGNGKSLIARVLSYCIGSNHVEDIDPEDFCNSGGKFNGYIKNHRLGVLEELKTGSRNQAEAALKRFIGNDRVQVQNKGADQITVKTCINFLINSNHRDAIKITDHTRRFAVLFCDQQETEDLVKHGMQRGGDYFTELFDWFYNCGGWGIVANYLDTYQIADRFNPATLADKAPITSSFKEAIDESKTAPHLAINEVITSGKAGTLNGWISVQAIRLIMKNDIGMNPPTGKMIAIYLKAEGYIKHPSLTNQGRVTRAVLAEGGARSVIYVKSGSIQAGLTGSDNVTEKYMEAQGYLVNNAINTCIN